MRQLRKLFESLALFKKNPARTVQEAYTRLKAGKPTEDDIALLDNVIGAVVKVAAEDDDKPADKPAEAKP